ncbi:MAG: glycosyltransferase [Novosphingobium sp.]
MRTLLLSVPAPVQVVPDGYRLDTKFVEGMRAHVADWGGNIRCVIWESDDGIPFGRVYIPDELDFELVVLGRNAPVPDAALEGVSIALVSADMPGFSAICQSVSSAGIPYVLGVEYTLETRLRTLWLGRDISGIRKMRSSLWLLRNERQVRSRLKSAAGAQFNGFPAYSAYSPITDGAHLYLDNRMGSEMMATSAEMAARAKRLLAGQPLRLIHSGRLEPMKGSQDLLPVMRALAAMGVQATLDIYGTGSLEQEIREGLGEFGGGVRLHAPVDFKTELVPISRTQADIFLSCHRQSDPSCTYLEAMGCGLAIAGYRNRMWGRLSRESGAGVAVRLGSTRQLAEAIGLWNRDRRSVVQSARAGLSFAMLHDFGSEFSGRMAHLHKLVAQAPSA